MYDLKALDYFVVQSTQSDDKTLSKVFLLILNRLLGKIYAISEFTVIFR